MNAATCTTRAAIPTIEASRVLSRLCRHFAHKASVEFTAERGLIEFQGGARAELAAYPDRLEVEVTASDGLLLERLRGVVERHLVMVAFRDGAPPFDWTVRAPVSEVAT